MSIGAINYYDNISDLLLLHYYYTYSRSAGKKRLKV